MSKLFHYLLVILPAITLFGCYDNYSVDEDGLIITRDASCAVLKFDLYDTKHLTVLAAPGIADIDTLAQTIRAEIKFGTDITYLWPRFEVTSYSKLSPKVTGYVDFTEPQTYTVISGNRKIKKTYTVYVTIQQP